MIKIHVLFLSALALPLSTGIARTIPNPDELPQVACSDMRFSAAFLAKFARLILYRSGVGASAEVPAIVGAAGATSEIFDTSRE